MSSIPLIALSFVIGSALGMLYFGGLWLTVQRVTEGCWSRRMLLVSFLARALLMMLALYGLMEGGGARWEAVALGSLGFVAARGVLVRTLGAQRAAGRS